MSHKQSARSKRIDVVIDCLMHPLWRMHVLGDPKAPACYLIRKEPPISVADIDATIIESAPDFRYWTDERAVRGVTPQQAKQEAIFHLKFLLAEQIVNALAEHEHEKADG